MSSNPQQQAQEDLIYAILALDSYNRGYGAGLSDLTTDGSIGDWTIALDSSVLLEGGIRSDIPAGFYAIAYTNAATGEKVISYRGTDEPNPFAAHNDAVNAYGIALGAAPQGRVSAHGPAS